MLPLEDVFETWPTAITRIPPAKKAPLVRAEDAIILDNTKLTPEQQFAVCA